MLHDPASVSNSRKLCSLSTGSIYLAPSSLKGNPGFGVFTTRDISRQEPVLTGPDGPSVVVIDQGRNVPGTIRAAQRAQEELWGNYWWGELAGTDLATLQTALRTNLLRSMYYRARRT
jgi:hypothetical protein